MNDRKIVLIREILDQRKLKQQELEFYLHRKNELEKKLSFIRKELVLTDKILQLIDKDRIEEINSGL